MTRALSNLREDIGETKNLTAANPGRLAELRQTLKKHLEKVGGQMPTAKATGKPITSPRD